LLVTDIEKSKHFYATILGQNIVMDFGRNVSFEGGLSIWKKDYALDLIFKRRLRKLLLELTILRFILKLTI